MNKRTELCHFVHLFVCSYKWTDVHIKRYLLLLLGFRWPDCGKSQKRWKIKRFSCVLKTREGKNLVKTNEDTWICLLHPSRILVADQNQKKYLFGNSWVTYGQSQKESGLIIIRLWLWNAHCIGSSFFWLWNAHCIVKIIDWLIIFPSMSI